MRLLFGGGAGHLTGAVCFGDPAASGEPVAAESGDESPHSTSGRRAFAVEAGAAGHQLRAIMARLQIYQVLHVCSVITLIAVVFSAFAAPRPERKKFVMMLSGIAALVAIISAFGMISVAYGNHFTVWMIVKAVAWLGLAALPGVAFRRPELAKTLGWAAAALVLVAVLMVYLKPFSG